MDGLAETAEEILERSLPESNDSSSSVFEDDQDEEQLFHGMNDRDWLEAPIDESDLTNDGGGGSVSSCKKILYETIDDHTRVWDVLILIPNLLFLLFLLYRFRGSRQRLAATNAPVMAAFHGLVVASCCVGVLRCVIAIASCNANGHAAFNGQAADKVLWVLLRACLLATEFSVLAFAMLTGHLDSKASIRRVIMVASSVSLVFSSIQMILELGNPDPAFQISANQSLFGHGGRAFWAVSSALFALVYASVLVLPLTPCRRWLMLPHKRSFYYYATFLLVLNSVQAVGCGLTESVSSAVSNPGLCLNNMTTFIYFVAFPPIVYFTFLAQFFGSKVAQPTMLFSYKAQTDEAEDDLHHSRPSHFTLQTTSAETAAGVNQEEEEDLFAQDQQDTPIIINGTRMNVAANPDDGNKDASASILMTTTNISQSQQ